MTPDLWIILAIGAAFFQNLRFMLQKRLSTAGLSAVGATFARFVYSAPVIGSLVLAYIWITPAQFPTLTPTFFAYALVAAITQILATVCVVALFARRNFAVGITLKKSEVLQTVLVGLVVLGEGISALGLVALLLGLMALLILSDAQLAGAGGWRRFVNPSAGLGILSGAFFACAGVAVRGATLQLPADDLLLRAGLALALVTLVQVAVMVAWLVWRDRAQLGRVFAAWRIGGMVGVTSLAGSWCWFAAFSLQTAAYVYALGQIEVVFSVLGGALVFGERLSRREYAGVALLMVSLIALVLVT